MNIMEPALPGLNRSISAGIIRAMPSRHCEALNPLSHWDVNSSEVKT